MGLFDIKIDLGRMFQAPVETILLPGMDIIISIWSWHCFKWKRKYIHVDEHGNVQATLLN